MTVHVTRRTNTSGRPAQLPPHVISNEERTDRLLIDVAETEMLCEDGTPCDFEVHLAVGCRIVPDNMFPGKYRLAALNYTPKPAPGQPRKFYPAFTGVAIDINGVACDLQVGLDISAAAPGALKGVAKVPTETDSTQHNKEAEADNRDPSSPDGSTS
jgi:hypothetical protein